jgi:hypothetical protein
MRKFSSISIAVVAMAVNCAVSAADYKAPRLADGTPDLQGYWTNTTATPMERDPKLGMRRAYTEAEALAIKKEADARVEADAKPSDPNEVQKAGPLPGVGNYNLFWTERGNLPVKIDGEYRTSMVIDPPNGRIPPMKAGASMGRRGQRASGLGPSDGPEGRSLGERCILSFGSSAGPPMLQTMYNSTYQIVQSPGYVIFHVEMVHDARIVRIGGTHLPKSIKKWMGDSIGRWEGDTLVVETTNFRPEQTFRGTSENAVITERFRRTANDQIVYSFTVNDPERFTAPYTAELAFSGYPGPVYEYACHEGNYGLPGILAGARADEAAGRRAETQTDEER